MMFIAADICSTTVTILVCYSFPDALIVSTHVMFFVFATQMGKPYEGLWYVGDEGLWHVGDEGLWHVGGNTITSIVPMYCAPTTYMHQLTMCGIYETPPLATQPPN